MAKEKKFFEAEGVTFPSFIVNAAHMIVALLARGVIGSVMALAIKQVETPLLRWRPEYRARP